MRKMFFDSTLCQNATALQQFTVTHIFFPIYQGYNVYNGNNQMVKTGTQTDHR